MSADPRLADYLKKLSRALSGLAESDRQDILREIGAHLEHRADEGKLDEALKALGAPQACARGFVDELKLQEAFTDSGPAKTFSALLALASRRVTAAAGLFVSGVFFLFAFAFAIICVAEIVAPQSAGLWVNPARDSYVLGVVDKADDGAVELLGRWLIPVAAALCVGSLLIGQVIGRMFIRRLMKGAADRAR